jgi:hypothetical protein
LAFRARGTGVRGGGLQHKVVGEDSVVAHLVPVNPYQGSCQCYIYLYICTQSFPPPAPSLPPSLPSSLPTYLRFSPKILTKAVPTSS